MIKIVFFLIFLGRAFAEEGPLCQDPPTEKISALGATDYIVPKINAHQGPLISEKDLKNKFSSFNSLTPQQLQKLKERFFLSPPEPGGLHSDIITIPNNLAIRSVDYICQGEYCGWCYHPKGGYQADIKITGNSFQWRRVYTGREVNEIYRVHWLKVGNGPIPPKEVVIEKKLNLKGPRNNNEESGYALSRETEITNQLMEELKENGDIILGRVCPGGETPPNDEKIKECCKEFGGKKRVWSFTDKNWQIECIRPGPSL